MFDPYHTWLGIRNSEQPPNHYRLLGIELFEAEVAVIENAADRQMAHVRSFQAGRHSDQSQAVLNEIAKARVTLLNDTDRKKYDGQLRAEVVSTRESSGVVLITPSDDARGRPVRERTRAGRATRQEQSRSWPIVVGVALAVVGLISVAIMTASHAYSRAEDGGRRTVASNRAGGSTSSPKSDRSRGRNSAELNPDDRRPKSRSGTSRIDRKPAQSVVGGGEGLVHTQPETQGGVVDGSREEDPFGPPVTGQTATGDGHTRPAPKISATKKQATESHPRLPGFVIRAESDSQNPRKSRDAQTVASGCAGMAPKIIDNGNAGFAERGKWRTPSLKEGYGGDNRVLEGVDKTAFATWTFQVRPGIYHVSVTWSEHENRSKDAPFSVWDGKKKVFVARINQRVAPDRNVTMNGESFQHLGKPVPISGSDLVVRLETSSTGFIVADAVRVECVEASDLSHVGTNSDHWILPVPRDSGQLALSGEMPVPEDSRIEIPADAAIARAKQQISELYRLQYDQARHRREHKLALAKKLLFEARATQDDVVGQFVMMREAQQLALAGRSAETYAEAVDSLAKRYKIDRLTEKVAGLKTLGDLAARNASTTNQRLLAVLTRTMAECVESEQFENAADLAKLAVAVARKLRDNAWRDIMLAAGKNIVGMQGYFDAAKEGLDTLRTSPKDATANFHVGRYLCLVRSQWEGGLPYLVRGNNTDLAGIATRDLMDPDSGAEKMAVANSWWRVASGYRGSVRKAIRYRAVHWYRLAVPDLKGLDKRQALARIDEATGVTKSFP